MTDRELLELAAKAAGLYDEWPAPDFGVQWNGDGLWCFGMGKGELWNPLTDDGDAFRLAVELRLTINPYQQGVFVSRYEGEAVIAEPFDVPGCNAEAARRAIVRAAAEIGKALK